MMDDKMRFKHVEAGIVIALALFIGVLSLTDTFSGIFGSKSSGNAFLGESITGFVVSDTAADPGIPDALMQKVNFHDDQISIYSDKYQVPPELIKAVMTQESGGDPDAVSECGSAGLMQFTYNTAKGDEFKGIFGNDLTSCDCVQNKRCVCDVQAPVCDKANDARFDPGKSIEAGAAYLSNLLRQNKGNIPLALVAYNAGPAVSQHISDNINGQEITISLVLALLPSAINSVKQYNDLGSEFTANKIVETGNYIIKVSGYYTSWGGKNTIAIPSDRSGIVPQQENANAFMTRIPEIGTYSVNPSFSVPIDYDINDYFTIKGQVLGKGTDKGLIDLVGECKSGKPIDECLAEAAKEINLRKEMADAGLKIYDGPCDERENVWGDMAEGIGECISSSAKSSSQQDCACPFTVRHSILAANPEEVSVALKKELGTTFVSLETNSLTLNYALDAEVSDKEFTFSEPESRLFLLRRSSAIPEVSAEDGGLSHCPAARDAVKVCVRSSKKFPVFDEQSQKTVLKPVDYKFAMRFGDRIPPPPITGIIAVDRPMAEKDFIAQWQASPDNDLSGYDIITSPSSKALFSSSIDTFSLKKEASVTHYSLDSAKSNIEQLSAMPDFSRCNFDSAAKTCAYLFLDLPDLSPIILQSGVLYEVKGAAQSNYFSIITSAGNEKTDVSVTAIDLKGNEINNIDPEQKLSVSSVDVKDDLPPGMILGLSVAPLDDSASQLQISFVQPVTNIDGTPMADLAGFQLYTSQSQFSSVSAAAKANSFTTSICSGFSCSFIIQNPGAQFYAVTALDSGGNEWNIAESMPPQSGGQ